MTSEPRNRRTELGYLRDVDRAGKQEAPALTGVSLAYLNNDRKPASRSRDRKLAFLYLAAARIG